MTEDQGTTAAGTEPAEDDDEGRVGIFPSWRATYIAVLVYTAALTGFLYLMTRVLDHSVR
jgi:hypothetical protein